MTASTTEYYADRLRRRGDFRLGPSERVVRTWQDDDLREHREFGPCWAIAWWPHGQGPGRHEGMGNPFVQRTFIGDSIEEVFRSAFEETTPQSRSIDDMAWRRERARDRAKAEAGQTGSSARDTGSERAPDAQP